MSISSKTAEMIVKQLIYDSCMIGEKGTKVSEKAAFFFCYAARLLSIFIFKISLVFSIITFREVILQK